MNKQYEQLTFNVENMELEQISRIRPVCPIWTRLIGWHGMTWEGLSCGVYFAVFVDTRPTCYWCRFRGKRR